MVAEFHTRRTIETSNHNGKTDSWNLFGRSPSLSLWRHTLLSTALSSSWVEIFVGHAVGTVAPNNSTTSFTIARFSAFRGKKQLDRSSDLESQEALDDWCVRSSCPICSDGYDDLLHLLWCPGIPPPLVSELSLPLVLLRHNEDRFRGPNLVGIFDEATSDWVSSIGFSPRPFSLRVLSLWHSRWEARVRQLPPDFHVFR